YDNGDNLLFRREDLETPEQSPLFQQLLRFDDPLLRILLVHLMQAAQRPLEQTPLLEDLVPGWAASSPSVPGKQVQAHQGINKGQVSHTTLPAPEPQTLKARLASSTATDNSVGHRLGSGGGPRKKVAFRIGLVLFAALLVILGGVILLVAHKGS